MLIIQNFTFEARFANWAYQQVLNAGVSKESAMFVKMSILIGTLLIVVLLMDWIARKIILSLIKRYSQKINHPFLNELVDKKTFKFLGHIIPFWFAQSSLKVVLYGFESVIHPLEIILALSIIFVIHQFVQSVLKVLKVIMLEMDSLKDKPIASFVQLGGMIVSILALLFAVSVITEKSLLSLLTAVGAMSAALLLIFKDVLLGLSASIKISSQDMLRNGDWVEFSKYGADGKVIDINLSTVRIQNWDHTFTTIPTTAFTTDAFKNWRGMEESDGRRIKRAINIKQSSVRFCTPQMLSRFKKNPLLTDYIETKQIELDAYNTEIERTGKGVRKEFTNLGLFRVYLKNYLLQNPEINKNLSLIVRQLSPTDKGVPVEIYCFSKDKVWSDYETVQSDIFDHVFASIHLFDLEIFESPSHENESNKAIDASELD